MAAKPLFTTISPATAFLLLPRLKCKQNKKLNYLKERSNFLLITLIMAVCISVIGKDNSPQFIASTNPSLELQFQYQLHTALDMIEEKLSTLSTTDLRKHYLGYLHATEEHKIYGYATNTKIKFIIIVDTSNVTLRDNDIQTMFRKLHNSYVDVISNPFYIPGDPLTSKKFHNIVHGILSGAT